MAIEGLGIVDSDLAHALHNLIFDQYLVLGYFI